MLLKETQLGEKDLKAIMQELMALGKIGESVAIQTNDLPLKYASRCLHHDAFHMFKTIHYFFVLLEKDQNLKNKFKK
jgi:hypothetical protein